MKDIDLDKIIDILNKEIENVGINREMLDIDLAELGMDSIAFVKIIVSLESAFEFDLPVEFMLIEELGTINKIVQVLELVGDKENEE